MRALRPGCQDDDTEAAGLAVAREGGLGTQITALEQSTFSSRVQVSMRFQATTLDPAAV